MRQSYSIILMLVILLVLVVCGLVWGQERDCPWCAGLHERVAALEERVAALEGMQAERETIKVQWVSTTNCPPCERLKATIAEFERLHPQYEFESRKSVGREQAPFIIDGQRRLVGEVSLQTLEEWLGVE